jgi:RNA polymerase sigma-70 factor (ECF subfamily)
MVKYKSSSERFLINKSKKGSTEAFEELIFRSRGYLTGWINKKTQNETDTEEILQITYIKCWRNIKKFKGKSGFKTWACTISRNLFIDRYRKKQKSREMSLEESNGAYEYVCHTSHEGLRSLENEELGEQLLGVLDNLPKIHKDVLSCFAVEELSYKEISKKLGCSVGTVMSRLFYARKKAKVLIQKNKELKRYGNNK